MQASSGKTKKDAPSDKDSSSDKLSAVGLAGKDRSFEDQAGPVSRFFVTYMNPLLAYGGKNHIVHEDLGVVSDQDRAALLYNEFEKHMANELKLEESKRSLWNVLWQTVGYSRLYNALLLYGVYAAIAYGPIFLLNVLAQDLQGTNPVSDVGLGVCVALMFVLPVIGSVFAAQSNIILAHIGLQFRNVLITKIYRKSLKLNSAARIKMSTGMIVNMFSTDTQQLQRFLFFLNNCSLAPFQIGVSLYLIYRQVGPATFVGLGLLIILTPLSGFIFSSMNTLRKRKMSFTDTRVKLMNEVLSGIRVIKYYAWEKAFNKKISDIRLEELHILKLIAYIVAVGFTLVMFSAPIVQPILIFYTYVKTGHRLDAATAFTTIALFNLMQLPFAFLPMGLAQFSQSMVSSKRMLDFFARSEIDDYVHKDEAADGTVISFDGVSMAWTVDESSNKNSNPDSKATVTDKKEGVVSADNIELTNLSTDATITDEKPTLEILKNLSFSVIKGQLLAIVGPVGCGKSSLVSAMLGEMTKTAGTVRVAGSVAYCDQKPWILNATLKDNITFGEPFNEEKFNSVIASVNLADDIRMLPAGVLTEIGERGINLSGGQKARVAVARAVYKDVDVYLLDDVLSALDAQVGHHVFHECILKHLRARNKTVVLVTHSVHLLDKADVIIVMDGGKVKACGSYKELGNSGIDIQAYVPRQQVVAEVDENDTEIDAVKGSPARKRTISTAKNPVEAQKFDEKAKEKGKNLMTIEERNTGDVSSAIYTWYIRAGGIGWFASMLLFYLASQVVQVISSFYLAYWGAETVKADLAGEPMSSNENLSYLNTFAWISMIGVGTITLRSVLLAQHRLGTSTALHEQMLTTILNAPVAFFDVTPLGRILNRFSSDMNVVDEELSQTTSQVLNSLFACVGSVGAIAGATKGTFLVLLVPIVYVYANIQTFFRKSNTAVARLESVSRSPIYADFSQTLVGASSVRAYGESQRFIDHLELQLDRNSIAAITSQLAGQWLAIRLDILGAFISFFVALIAVVTKKEGFIPAGYMALGLTYSFQLTQFLKFCVRMMATIESLFSSVERIKYYIDNVPQEKAVTGATDVTVPDTWPSAGCIEAKEIKMAYRDGPLVLKGINFNIGNKQKVGIAGRTGSGKSTLMIALFRIEELTSGTIAIDGIDCASIPLPLLRSKIGIIPQDSVMFSATIRFNLDPFNEHSDAEIWDILQKVNLKDHISNMEKKLDEDVAEGGENFSVGQRQLICIGRALLRKPKILVMDEATASIDNTTDSLIQSMVRETFKESTILTIAHRLHTIIDSDKIILLKDGLVEEDDAPANLLNRQSGFKELWDRHQQY
jgi:ATP-binding cassette subfamily C (CFTR/MRP) protein 1